MMKAGRRYGLTAAAFALILDQGTKALALDAAPALSRGVEILPVLDLVLVRNRGVSFGMFGAGMVPWWALTLVALVIVGWLAAWLWRTESRVLAVALGLVIGGALGNVVDRWWHGAVTDFIDLHAGGWHWPAFNLADVAIVSGIAVLLIHSVIGSDDDRPWRPDDE